MSPSLVTTHVLDTALGRPAAGIEVRLQQVAENGAVVELGTGTTDADGRVPDLGPAQLEPATYRLVFDTGGYLGADGAAVFFPYVMITFAVADGTAHHHVPLLLSPYAYSTYRGS